MDQENLSSAADKFGINYNWGTFSSGIPSSEHISAFSSVNNALHGHTIPQVKIFFERKTINFEIGVNSVSIFLGGKKFAKNFDFF